jgi:hypothetical protein
MKGKIMIALVVLALIFGLGLASCDNGAQPKIDNGLGSGKDNITLDASDSTKGDVEDAILIPSP